MTRPRIATGFFALTNDARLSTSTFGQGDAGNIIVNARERVFLDKGGYADSTLNESGRGKGGDIRISTGEISMTNGARLVASTFGQGDAGSIIVNAHESFFLDGNSTAAFASVAPTGRGKGGDIRITTKELSLTNGSELLARTRGQGDAGSVIVDASNRVSLDGTTSDGIFPSAAFSSVDQTGIGRGGDIRITTKELLLTNGAALVASTKGQGDAGSVIVDASNRVSLDGTSSDNRFGSAAFSNVDQTGIGKGGDIRITTKELSLTNGAQLLASTSGQGDAGSVIVDASNRVSLDGTSSSDSRFASAAFSSVNQTGIGKGGDIRITTRELSLTNGAGLVANTSGQGDAGSVIVNAHERVSLDGVGSPDFLSAAFSGVEEMGRGKGGDIRITTGKLSLTNGAQLLASTSGQGDAGSVIVNAHERVSLDGITSGGFPTAVFSTVAPKAAGNSGGINISTKLFSITNGAHLSTSSEGNGAAGNIEVAARSIRLDNQALLRSDTVAGQGNIFLRSRDLRLLGGSSITTNATGTASGGNINIHSNLLIALQDSSIRANAEEAFGGRIEIEAQGIFRTADNDITATSELGSEFSGTVELDTPDVDPSRGLVSLPVVPIDTQVPQSCTPGGSQTSSEFVVTGRGGLPPNPTEALSSDAIQVDWVTLNPKVENRSSPAVSTNPTAPHSDSIVEAQGWMIDNNGEIVLTASAPSTTPNKSWQTPAKCHTTRNSS